MRAHRIPISVVALVIAAASAVHAQQTAEELYQAGLYQEEVQGNLESAIAAAHIPSQSPCVRITLFGMNIIKPGELNSSA